MADTATICINALKMQMYDNADIKRQLNPYLLILTPQEREAAAALHRAFEKPPSNYDRDARCLLYNFNVTREQARVLNIIAEAAQRNDHLSDRKKKGISILNADVRAKFPNADAAAPVSSGSSRNGQIVVDHRFIDRLITRVQNGTNGPLPSLQGLFGNGEYKQRHVSLNESQVRQVFDLVHQVIIANVRPDATGIGASREIQKLVLFREALSKLIAEKFAPAAPPPSTPPVAKSQMPGAGIARPAVSPH